MSSSVSKPIIKQIKDRQDALDLVELQRPVMNCRKSLE